MLVGRISPPMLVGRISPNLIYQQVVLEPESRKYVTINTHIGLYQTSVQTAPAVFQQTMEKILQVLPIVVVYIDDILVSGHTDEEHVENLEKVLQRLQQYGLQYQMREMFLPAVIRRVPRLHH